MITVVERRTRPKQTMRLDGAVIETGSNEGMNQCSGGTGRNGTNNSAIT